MVILNGKKFAANDKEFISSLHQAEGTCVGYYKPSKNRVRLFNPQMEMIGVITCYGVLVKASPINENQKGKAKFWYNFGDIKEICEDRFKGNRPSEERDEIHEVLKQFNIQRKY